MKSYHYFRHFFFCFCFLRLLAYLLFDMFVSHVSLKHASKNKDIMICFVIISYQTTGICPNGWESFRRWCYYVDEKKLDYWQARSACRDMGGILTSVLDEEEQIFINGKSELRT